MKTFRILVLSSIIALLCPILIQSQMSKFQKWQQPSYFIGFNMSVWDNYDQREVNQEDFDSLKAIGANLVIIQTPGGLTPEPPYYKSIFWTEGTDTVFYIDMLDNMVNYARQSGLNYVIAVRDGPGRYDISTENTINSTVWTNPDEQKHYGSMLRSIAARYLPDELFAGLDMAVEPDPLGNLYGTIPIDHLEAEFKANNIDMNKLYSLWIDSVRTADKELPLLVEGIAWSNPEYFSLMKKQADGKVVYNAHLYNPHDFSHADPENTAEYPGEYWSERLLDMYIYNKALLESEIYKPLIEFQQTANVPVIVGEFGLLLPQSGGEQYLQDIAEIACGKGWHYSFWMFNDGSGFNYKDMDAIYGTNYYTLVKKLMKCSPLDIAEQEIIKESMNIKPNPAGDYILVQPSEVWQPSEGLKACIYNYLGECVISVGIQNFESLRLDISHLSQGIYMLRIGAEHLKFVKD